MTALVVAPTGREARAAGERAVACGAGAGAGPAVARFFRDARPSLVVLVGVCGALDPSLRPGDLVLARRVLGSSRPELYCAAPLLDAVRSELRRSGLPFVTSALLTVERPLASLREKADAWNASGAAAVDMESYAVAAAAGDAGTPWVIVRSVVDPASAALPASLRGWRSEADDRAAARAAVLRPWEWPAYLRLAWALREATRALHQATPLVIAAGEATTRSAPGVSAAASAR